MKRRLCSLIEIGFVKCQFNFPPCYNSSLGALIGCGLCVRRRCEGAHFIKLNRKRSKFIRVKQPEPKYCDFFMTGKNVLRYISWMGLTGVMSYELETLVLILSSWMCLAVKIIYLTFILASPLIVLMKTSCWTSNIFVKVDKLTCYSNIDWLELRGSREGWEG